MGYLLKHAQLQMAESTAKALTPYGIDGPRAGVLVVCASLEPTSQQQAAQRLDHRSHDDGRAAGRTRKQRPGVHVIRTRTTGAATWSN